MLAFHLHIGFVAHHRELIAAPRLRAALRHREGERIVLRAADLVRTDDGQRRERLLRRHRAAVLALLPVLAVRHLPGVAVVLRIGRTVSPIAVLTSGLFGAGRRAAAVRQRLIRKKCVCAPAAAINLIMVCVHVRHLYSKFSLSRGNSPAAPGARNPIRRERRRRQQAKRHAEREQQPSKFSFHFLSSICF